MVTRVQGPSEPFCTTHIPLHRLWGGLVHPGNLNTEPTMKKLLVFSYFYPPQKGIGGKRIFRLLSRLPAYGWQPTVLTTPWPPKDDRDLEQPLYAPGLSVDRGYVPEWFWSLYHGRDGSEYHPGPLAKVLSTAGRLLGYPLDGKIWLAPFAYRRAQRLAQEHHFDAVLSTSSPYSSHLIAGRLARSLGVPFYADFRDPWTFNFLWRNRPPLQKRLDAYAETSVLTGAEKVFFAAKATEQKYRELYPTLATKMQTIYSGFEPDVAASPALPWPGERPRIAVAHFGRFYGVRRMDKMLGAVAAAVGGLSAADFQCLVLGEIQPKDQTQINEMGLQAFFKVSPMMPYEKGLSILRGADVLFLCDYDVEPYFVPGKLFDYLRVGRPIFALSANQELRDLIHQTQTGVALHPEDVEGQERLWKDILTRGPREALRFSPRDTQTLSADYAAERLASAITR